MTVLAAAVVIVVVLCWLHGRAINAQRRTLEDRLDAQAQRHAQDLRKLVEATTTDRDRWHRTLQDQQASADRRCSDLLAQIEQERTIAADERVQLMNRIKPETFHPPLSQPEAISTPPAVRFEDDDGYWRASESRDELVERIEREMNTAKVHS
jgi:hypothetical protein